MSALAETVTENVVQNPLAALREAVAEDLMTLAVMHDRELDGERILALWDIGFEEFLGLRLLRREGREALGLFHRGLTDIPGVLDQQTLDVLAAEYADIYLNNSYGASPVESVWIDEDGLIMQEPMFQVRDWYRRYDLAVPDWRKRTDDHLVHQLQFLSRLLGPGQPEAPLQEAARFMDEHLLRWVGRFAERIGQRCSTRFYAGLALLTAGYLEELRDLLAELTEEPRPTSEEVEERMKPKLSVQVAGPAPFVPGAAPSW